MQIITSILVLALSVQACTAFQAQVHSGVLGRAKPALSTRGLPMRTSSTGSTGVQNLKAQVWTKGHDTQWQTMVDTFRGIWVGPTTWFGKGGKPEIDYTEPMQVIPESKYAISFTDDRELGEWRGTGLRFTEGELVLPLSREGFNMRGTTWILPGGYGGQCNVRMDGAEKLIFENNFFAERTRSMAIAIYEPTKARDLSDYTLDSVGVTPFRDQLVGSKVGKVEPYPSTKELMDSLKGWKGEKISMPLNDRPEDFKSTPCTLTPEKFLNAEVSKVLADNLVIGIPKRMKPVGNFDLYFGCKKNDSLFQQVTISWEDGVVTKVTRESYTPK